MAGAITFKVDASKAISGIKEDLEEIPFALALSLTRTVQAGQKKEQAEMPSKFTIRKKRVLKGIRIEKATKNNLTATLKDIDPFMALQDEGIARRDDDQGFTTKGDSRLEIYGEYVCIPFEAARPSAGRAVREADTPREVIANGGFIKKYDGYAVLFRKANNREAKKYTVRRGGTDRALVSTVNGAAAVAMWLLYPQASNKPRLKFAESFEQLLDSGEWERQFDKAFADAIKD